MKKFHSRVFVISSAENAYITQRCEGKEVVSTRVHQGKEEEKTTKPLSSADAEYERMGAPLYTNPVTLGLATQA